MQWTDDITFPSRGQVTNGPIGKSSECFPMTA